MATTIRISLYKQKKLRDGTHPILLVVTKNRKRKRISLGISCTPEDWNNKHKMIKSNVPNFQNKNRIISKARHRADSILFQFQDIGKDFSLAEFEEKYKGSSTTTEVFSYFDERIAELKKAKKFGNAEVYTSTNHFIRLRSIK